MTPHDSGNCGPDCPECKPVTKGPKKVYTDSGPEFEERTTSVLLNKVGEASYSDKNWQVDIVDEGGGEFLEITQFNGESKIRLDPSEWEPLKNLIDKMIKECRDE